MFGDSNAQDLEAWLDKHDELLALAAKAVPYMAPSVSSGSLPQLPYARATDLIAALAQHTNTLRRDIAEPLRQRLRSMSLDIAAAVSPAKLEAAQPDDRWIEALRGMSLRSLVEQQAASATPPKWHRRIMMASSHLTAAGASLEPDDTSDDDSSCVVGSPVRFRTRRRGRHPSAAVTGSIVHPTLQRLLRMTPEEMEERRAQLILEQQHLASRTLSEEGEHCEEGVGISVVDTSPVSASAVAASEDGKKKEKRSPSALLQSAVNKSTIGLRFMKRESSAAEALRRIAAPFPYAFEIAPTATFLRKLARTLEEGKGCTVIPVDFTSGFPIVKAILVEAEEPHVGMLEFAKALTKDGLRAIVSIREAMPHGSTEASWRKEAEHRQFQRHLRGSAVLAKRSSDVLRERLSFAADRPKGVLELLAEDFAPVVKCHFSTSITPPGGPEFTLFYPKTGIQMVYFATRSEADSFVSISTSPWLVCPESYAMCSVHPMYGGCVPQNWVLEGSNDNGATFTVLRRHTNDESFLRGSDFAVFDIPLVTYTNPLTKETCSRRFFGSLFRIRCTGENALGSLNLQCAAVEFYGRAMTCLELPPLSELARPTPAEFFGDSMAKTLTYGVPAGRKSALPKAAKALRPLPAHPPDAPVKAKGGKKK
jgi:hypothetical protein